MVNVKRSLGLTALLLTLGLAGAALAVPATLQHQGRIIDDDGDPLQGSTMMTFKLYDAPAGGDALWTEEFAKTFVDGYYSVQLGENEPLAGVLNTDTSLYLGVAVDGGAEFTPRFPLSSVPYALGAGRLDAGTAVDVSVLALDGTAVIASPSDVLGGLPCLDGQVPKHNGATWVCGDDLDTQIPNTDTLAALSCINTEIAKWNSVSGTWQCAEDVGAVLDPEQVRDIVEDDPIDLDNGSTLNGDVFVVVTDPDVSCTDGDGVAWDASGEWVCVTPGGETDPVFGASPAFGIAGGDIVNWDLAWGWGDHAAAGYLESDPGDPVTQQVTQTEVDAWNATAAASETDPIFGASPAFGIAAGDITSWTGTATTVTNGAANWNAAYGWGDHATEGYLTSFTEQDPIFGASPAFGIAAGDITSWTGTATAVAAGSANWTTAFGWGDHATEGYLTSFTEADPIFDAHAAKNVTTGKITNWDTAFGWGNHAGVGYLTASSSNTLTNKSGSNSMWTNDEGYVTAATETDPVFGVAPAAGITGPSITSWTGTATTVAAGSANWTAAYGWGDHATEGYLKSFTEQDPDFAASPAFGIAAGDITSWTNTATQVTDDSGDWDTAFGWGDHATEGYLTAEVDPTFVALAGPCTGDQHIRRNAADNGWECADPPSSGGVSAYGDGSAGALTINADTDWTAAAPVNTQYTTCSIEADGGPAPVLTVPSGTVIRCTGAFTLGAGASIAVAPGIPGSRWLGNADGMPEQAGLAAAPATRIGGRALPPEALATILNPGPLGGGNGDRGCGSANNDSGTGAGTLVIRAAGDLTIDGAITADGGDAVAPVPDSDNCTDGDDPDADDSGSGGGGGGIVVIATSGAFAGAGTISASGGAGSDAGACGPFTDTNNDSAGGGGGGGVIHILAAAPNPTTPTLSVSGGAKGIGAGTFLGASGGGGGAMGGAGGGGGTGTGEGSTAGEDDAEAGSDGQIFRSVVTDPGPLFL